MSGVTDPEDESPGPARRPLPGRAVDGPRQVVAHRRPDSRPMRLAYGAGALAALSVMSAGLVQLGSPSGTTDVITTTAASDPPPIEVRHVIRYIHLKPGEVAPPGATVIAPDAPAPRVVITRLAAPPAPPRRIAVTRQSGRP
jgi:hypothetical protein